MLASRWQAAAATMYAAGVQRCRSSATAQATAAHAARRRSYALRLRYTVRSTRGISAMYGGEGVQQRCARVLPAGQAVQFSRWDERVPPQRT
jgi:Tfp pilus assembly protein PilV